MKKFLLSAILISSTLSVSHNSAYAAPQKTVASLSFRLEGAVAKPQNWTKEQLEKAFAEQIQTINYTLHDKSFSARCVPLLTLIQAAQPKADAKRKGALLSFVAVVRGRDGYCASFSLGEMLPENGARPIWLALDCNGQPLPDKEAPARLVVPGEKKPSRWLYGIASITIKDEANSR